MPSSIMAIAVHPGDGMLGAEAKFLTYPAAKFQRRHD
jgi:hypothetical protein